MMKGESFRNWMIQQRMERGIITAAAESNLAGQDGPMASFPHPYLMAAAAVAQQNCEGAGMGPSHTAGLLSPLSSAAHYHHHHHHHPHLPTPTIKQEDGQPEPPQPQYQVGTAVRYHPVGTLKRDHARKPHQCGICSKSFTTKSYLSQHVAMHRDGKALCPVCNKSFTVKWYVRDHMRLHTGEKPFSCPVCGKAFSFKSHLDWHRSKHAATPE